LNNEEQNYDELTLPSRTFRVANGRVVGIIDEYDAMVQAIDKILQTERFVYPIYSENYGNDLEDLVGKDFEYIKVESERMLDEALKADERITDVFVDDVKKIDSNSMLITVSVQTIFGNVDISQEVRQ
jgi:hypothetical protein